MAEVPNINPQAFDKVTEIASSSDDRPVLMLNLNTYFHGQSTMSADAYQDNNAAVDAVLIEVKGEILWCSPMHGQPVGKQNVYEILAIWYPSHQAFVKIKDAPSSARVAEAKNKVLKPAVIHRSDPYAIERTPLAEARTMMYTHIFTLANGETSCGLISTELKNSDFVKNSQQVAIKDFGDAKHIKFCSLPKGWDGGWHNLPVKQFAIGVSGAIQITRIDTSQVIVITGEVALLEDLTEKGQYTQVTSNENWSGVLMKI